ncbi:unnamed protein product [Aureobasidium uvarum]|uniref:Uncharacterized protein n=1 Tax=Aureobasidium uvarum TaxID=2773716 RepID=A0A9N8PSC5_9PEZI|nr:unnamed protein product [Aureobasidium uvarum]
MWTFLLTTGLAFFQIANACESYGIDFKNNRNYFIDINSNESFTAVSEFYGCSEPARAILYTPSNHSIFCSDVATTPDYTDATTTCPILKNQMYSGDWTLVLLDNNGNGSSFNAQRKLHLSVGEQSTSVVIPTITLIVTQTPTSIVNATITDVDSTTLQPVSVTSLASNAKTQTVTYYPPRETITKSSTATVKHTSTRFTYTIKTYTETKLCAVAFAALAADPTADPKLLSIAQAAIASATPSAAPARRARIRRDVTQVVQVAKRNVVNLAKRAPDSATVTSTDTNTAHWISVTSSFTAAPVTQTSYTTAESTTTITPAPVTIVESQTTVTKTAATSTRTITRRTTTTSKITKTVTATLKVTTYVPGKGCS